MPRYNNFKDRLKSHHQTFYDLARATRTVLKNSKTKRLAAKDEQVTHRQKVSVSAPLSKIYVSSGPKRINLVFADFTAGTVQSESISNMLELATKIATKKGYELRIISRNNLPDPKLYVDFLASKRLIPPEKYSFYTDSSDRISSPIYRLEVSDMDVFFTADDLEKMKGWINGQK